MSAEFIGMRMYLSNNRTCVIINSDGKTIIYGLQLNLVIKHCFMALVRQVLRSVEFKLNISGIKNLHVSI